jgi:hypothetical protein
VAVLLVPDDKRGLEVGNSEAGCRYKKPAESAVHSHVLSFFVSIFGF